MWKEYYKKQSISIHAPPRGATRLNAPRIIRELISIHAPPRGATLARIEKRSGAKYFNSRPSARGDARLTVAVAICTLFQFTPLREGRRLFSIVFVGISAISIHAPPRGATPFPFLNSLHHVISIHAPPRGATKDWSPPLARWINFNSRPSARGDGKRYAISANLLFNPYKSAWLNNSATQFVEIILVIFHRIIV